MRILSSDFAVLNRGTVFSVGYGLLFAAQISLGKYLLTFFPTMQLAFMRSVIHLASIVSSSLWEDTISHNYGVFELSMFCFSAVFNTSAWIFTIASLQFLETGDGMAIEQGFFVVYSVFFGWIFFTETFDVLDVCLQAINIVGIVLVSRPSFIFGASSDIVKTSNNGPGVMLCLAAGLVLTLGMVTTKKLKNKGTLNVYILLILHGFFGVPLTLTGSLFFDPWKLSDAPYVLTVLALYCGVSLGQTVVKIIGICEADISNMALSSTIGLSVEYVIQITAFRVAVSWVAILGVLLILCSVGCLQLKTRVPGAQQQQS